MKKAISYSLFGFGKERAANCFDFHSYLRGLLINVRLNRLMFPDWEMIVHVDRATYEAYEKIFESIGIIVKIEDDAPLCLAMLWRMKPIFEMEGGVWKYSHVICRDLDSPTTYRDAQAVDHWVQNDKAAHAITDSVSHTIPLMGGMIGFRPDYITERIGQTWDEMIAKGPHINFNRKGSDQDFLNQIVYPTVASPGSDSITQHYFDGLGNTFLSDFHTCDCAPVMGHKEDCKLNFKLPLKEGVEASNQIAGHIGASGWYEGELFRFLRPYWDDFKDLIQVEKFYPQIFYWNIN